MVPNAAVMKQAEQSRIDGNHYFKKNRYGAAIDAYTQAITLCPNVPVYYTNRALCHLKRNDWEKVEEDCRRAIKLDSSMVKAHYMLGLALIQKQEYAKGIRELEKALDLGRGAKPKGYMVEEIWQELAKAKYLEWERSSTRRSWELQILKEACESALKEKHFLEASETEGFVDDAAISHLKQLEALEVVFNKAGEDDKPAEVPDYLCCRITLDIFHDPVITPSGLTYERAVILDHLQKVGKFDPVTREPLDQSQLVPNLAIKEAVQAFLDKHGRMLVQVWPMSSTSYVCRSLQCPDFDYLSPSYLKMRLSILAKQNNYLSIYLADQGNLATMPIGWCSNEKFELALVNQVDASRTIVKETGKLFHSRQPGYVFNNFIHCNELCNSSKGFIVDDTCIVEYRLIFIKNELPSVSTPTLCDEPVKHPDNLLPKETSIGDLVDFRGLGKIVKDFVPLLEEVCSWHPSLVDCMRKKNRTRMFTEWAFTALGRVLHFLKTKKVKDMNEDACNCLQILWEELETVGFDLSWLEPHFQSAMGMKTYFERAANVKKLKENVDALEKDLQIAASKLAEAENGFVERDLDGELGYGAP